MPGAAPGRAAAVRSPPGSPRRANKENVRPRAPSASRRPLASTLRTLTPLRGGSEDTYQQLLADVKKLLVADLQEQIIGPWRQEVVAAAVSATLDHAGKSTDSDLQAALKSALADEAARLGREQWADLYAAAGTTRHLAAVCDRLEADLQSLSEEQELQREAAETAETAGVGALQQRLAALEGRCADLAHLPGATSGVEARLSALEDSVRALEGAPDLLARVARLEAGREAPDATLRERVQCLADRVARVELDPVADLRALHAKTKAREAAWEQRMSEHRERLEQLDQEVRGKSELVAQMAERMRCVEVLETSVSNLVNLCESNMERHGQSVANMEVLMDEHNATMGRHTKGIKATDANVRQVQQQVLQLQKQLGGVLTSLDSSPVRDSSVPPSPVARGLRESPAPSPRKRASPPKPPWSRGTPVRRTPSTAARTPDALSGASEWLPVESESRIPRASPQRRRDDLAPYLAHTPSP